MKKNQMIALLFAVLVFLAVLINPFGKSKSVDKESLITVIVARERIMPQTQITESMLEAKEVLVSSVALGAVASIEEVLNTVAINTIYAGDVINHEKIASKGSIAAGVSVNIPVGMRAISMDVELSSGMSGLIKIGNHVDILSVIDSGTRKAVFVLQNSEVIGLDRTIVSGTSELNDDKQYMTITLAVSPEEALRLTLSTQMGTNRAVLRNDQDNQMVPHTGIEPNELLDNPTGGHHGN